MKLNLNVKSFIVLSFAFLSVGCGSLSHKKDDAALARVKKVAVVSFTADQPASATIGLNVLTGNAAAESGGSIIPQHSRSVNQMLYELQNTFSKNMHWSVMDQKTMVTNKGYEMAYHKSMDGIQMKNPPGKGLNRYIVENTMDYDCPRILGQAGREQLMNDLGVDGIITAFVKTLNSGFSVMGVGARHPQSYVTFAMYVRGVENPVWFEGSLEGEKSKESVGATGFTDEDATQRLALESARTAYAKIGL
jgi:hypothetical protein